MSGAEDLNVIGTLGRATLGIWDYVVKMEVLFGATLYATSFVSLPDSELHVARNYAIIF